MSCIRHLTVRYPVSYKLLLVRDKLKVKDTATEERVGYLLEARAGLFLILLSYTVSLRYGILLRTIAAWNAFKTEITK